MFHNQGTAHGSPKHQVTGSREDWEELKGGKDEERDAGRSKSMLMVLGIASFVVATSIVKIMGCKSAMEENCVQNDTTSACRRLWCLLVVGGVVAWQPVRAGNGMNHHGGAALSVGSRTFSAAQSNKNHP